MEQHKNSTRKMLLMMITGAMIIFFTGFVHIWTVYQPYVTLETGWPEKQASMGFYFSCCAFVLGNIAGGRLQNKVKPRVILCIGGGMLSLAVFLSSLCLSRSLVGFWMTYGVMQGFGQGMAYTVVLAAAQKWFPERTGFASGVIVTSNGLCGFFMVPLSRYLLAQNGPKTALLTVSGLIAAACILSVLFFSLPEQEEKKDEKKDWGVQKQYTSAELLRSRKYYLVVGAMFFGLLPYYMISPFSQTFLIEHGVSEGIAATAVMIGSLMNASTRLLLPTLSDKIGKIRCIAANFILLIITMLILANGSSLILAAAVVLTYVCFGGVMGSFPSLTSYIFGMKHFGENYGFVMFGLIAASLGASSLRSLLAGIGLTVSQTFWVGAALALAAFLCMTALGRLAEKEDVK